MERAELMRNAGCILLFLAASMAIFVIGESGRGWGNVRCVNRTEGDFWFSFPQLKDGLGTFQAERVPAHGSLILSADRPRPSEIYEVVVFEKDPGAPHPNLPAPYPPVQPVVSVTFTGNDLLRSRKEGLLELILSTRSKGLQFKVGNYVPPKTELPVPWTRSV